METGKLCFSVSVGVAYGTGQIVTVKGERVEISARKYYPYLDWLKAERTVSAEKEKSVLFGTPFLSLAEKSLPSRERGLKLAYTYTIFATLCRSLRGSVD